MPLTQNKQESAAAKWERIKSMGGAEKQEELRKAKVDLGLFEGETVPYDRLEDDLKQGHANNFDRSGKPKDRSQSFVGWMGDTIKWIRRE